jgi:hypothetical protein
MLNLTSDYRFSIIIPLEFHRGQVEASLATGRYRFELCWLPILRARPAQLYLNEAPIPAAVAENVAAGEVEIDSEETVRLAWTCPPLEAPDDPRLLGLPVASIKWRRVRPQPESRPRVPASIE